MNAIQLDLFEPNDEASLLKRELHQMKDSQRRNNKAMFAKIHDLGKVVIGLREELDGFRALFLKRKK